LRKLIKYGSIILVSLSYNDDSLALLIFLKKTRSAEVNEMYKQVTLFRTICLADLREINFAEVYKIISLRSLLYGKVFFTPGKAGIY